MTCQELIDFLDDYLSGALAPAQVAAFEEHLGECLDCRNYLASYKQTVRLGRLAYADDALPAELPRGLIAAILAARAKSPVDA